MDLETSDRFDHLYISLMKVEDLITLLETKVVKDAEIRTPEEIELLRELAELDEIAQSLREELNEIRKNVEVIQ